RTTMKPLSNLAKIALHTCCEAIGVHTLEGVARFLGDWFADPGQRLSQALDSAMHLAWSTLEGALGDEPLLHFLGRKENKNLRRELRAFLDTQGTAFRKK